MLRIYSTSLQMIREITPLARTIARSDRDLCRQLRRASSSVALNIAEGAGVRDGRRRMRYGDALGSARETMACLQVAEAAGYIHTIPQQVTTNLNHVIGVLVRLQ